MSVRSQIKNIDSSEPELRKFAYLFAGIFVLAAAVLFYNGSTLWTLFIAGSLVFIATGWLWPGCLKPFHIIWMSFAIILGQMISTLLLIVIFYLVVTPIALLGRTVGAQFLVTNFETEGDTFWNKREPSKEPPEYFEKQY